MLCLSKKVNKESWPDIFIEHLLSDSVKRIEEKKLSFL